MKEAGARSAVDRPALPLALGLAFGIAVGALRAGVSYLPLFVHPGEGIGALALAVQAALVLVSPVGATLAGYWLGGRVAVRDGWLAVLLLAGVGAFIGALAGYGAATAYAADALGSLHSTPSLPVVVLWRGLSAAPGVAVAVLAGAGVRAFRQA